MKKRGVVIALVVAFIVLLLASCGFIIGAVVANESTPIEQGGTLFADGEILADKQTAYSQKYGGFALLSSDSTSTKITLLKSDGSPDESSGGDSCIIDGRCVRSFVQDDVLYAVTSAKDGGKTVYSLTALPLDGSKFSALETVELSATLNIEPETICVVGGSSLSNSEIYYFTKSLETKHLDLNTMTAKNVTINKDDDVDFESMSFNGSTAYLSAYDMDYNMQIYKGDLNGDTINAEKTAETEVLFPLTFTGDYIIDSDGKIFNEDFDYITTLEGDCFTSGGGYFVSSNGKTLSIYNDSNLSSPIKTRTFSYNIKAVSLSDSNLMLLFDGNDGYRAVVSNVNTLISGNASSTTTEESSSIPAESSEDPRIPIHSSMPEESSSDQSTPSDNSSSTGSTENPPANITSSVYTIDHDGGYIFLPPDTTVAQLKKTITTGGGTMAFYTSEGAYYSTGKLGTGMEAELSYNDDVVESLKIVVVGDLNSNGVVNSADTALMYSHITEEKPLYGAYYLAADIDGDSVVDTKDLILQKKMYE